jgi:ABC-type transporter MlaC component
MPPPIRRETQSGLDYVGKGFWFAIGFTPVFIVLTTIATIVYINISAQIAEAAFERLNAEARHVVQRSIPVPQPVQQQEPEPYAALAPSERTPEQDAERACSVLMLRYSETKSPADKQRMLDTCPK